mgnify:CR=1 FL=1
MRRATGNRDQETVASRSALLFAACRLLPRHQSGFTFIELLVYLGLVSIALTVMTTLATALLQAEARGSVRETVDTSASRVLAHVTEAMRAATSIDVASSTFDVPLGRLSLIMRDAARSPTTFSVTNGRLEVTEGTGSATPLTAGMAEVVAFRLTRLNPARAKEGVRIELTIRFQNPSNNPQFEFSNTYVTGLVLH